MNVAALGPIVQQACEEGDAVATRIVEHAAEELVLAARSVATRLNMRGDAFTCLLAGGVFKVVPWLASELPRRLAETPISATHRPIVHQSVALLCRSFQGMLSFPRGMQSLLGFHGPSPGSHLCLK